MSLSDPQSITIGGVTSSLPQVNSGNYSSDYASADNLVHLLVSHNYGKRIRRVIRVNHQKVAADPLLAAVNRIEGCSIYTVFDIPANNIYTPTQVMEVYDGFRDQLGANTDALITKVLGGES